MSLEIKAVYGQASGEQPALVGWERDPAGGYRPTYAEWRGELMLPCPHCDVTVLRGVSPRAELKTHQLFHCPSCGAKLSLRSAP
jgi:predicted RNA-binding Zn-ribbon protein involved in translation (DUF1610 family)